MAIDKVKQELNMKLALRDSLPVCELEMQLLEQNEAVKKYLLLKKHYEQYQELKYQSDDKILDGIIATDSETLEDDNSYFCYGKDYIGHPYRKGGYYIDNNDSPLFRLIAFKVAKYRNIANPNKIIIMPSDETEGFEEAHEIIHSITDSPESEYLEIRRNKFLQLLNPEPQKRLAKEITNND